MNIRFTSLTEEQNELYSTAQKLPVMSHLARYAIGVARLTALESITNDYLVKNPFIAQSDRPSEIEIYRSIVNYKE